MWPTPTASGFEVADVEGLLERRRRMAEKHGNNGFGLTLNQAVKIWPTPNARDWQGAPGAGCRARGGRRSSLPGSLKDLEGSGTLNPMWVEWLMGFPVGWTDLSNLETP
jgi:hypothetical protein